MSMLNRWIRVQAGTGEYAIKEKRPHLANLCETLVDCEKWRRQIMTEISKSVADIQNPGLGEFKIRDLNDAINKLVREKGYWELRILELGGPNYKKQAPTVDAEGNEVPGGKGYKYYGAARDLPGVRDLFKKDMKPIAKRSRADMYKSADAAYFGYRDEDDSLILPLEKSQEEEAVSSAVLEWTERQATAGNMEGEDSDEGEEGEPKEEFVAHVVVPSTESIEKAVLEQKKREMLEQYVSKEETAMQESAKAGMAGKRQRE